MMIKLKRLEVEGGFLDEVDLQFAEGLNVLIGARGSGKRPLGVLFLRAAALASTKQSTLMSRSTSRRVAAQRPRQHLPALTLNVRSERLFGAWPPGVSAR
jgi:hypothetical protein